MFSKRWMVLLIIMQIRHADAEPVRTNLLPNTTICGISSPFDKFPWMALIVYELRKVPDDAKPQKINLRITARVKSDYFCNGFLISKRYVLTSAECLQQIVFRRWKLLGVRLGEFKFSTDPHCIKTVRGVQCAPPPLDIQVEEQASHEDYMFLLGTPQHDVGLVRLKKEVEFTETVRPICLPTTPEERSKTYKGRRLTVAGWGEFATGLPPTGKLKVELPVYDHKVCKSKYKEVKVDFGDGQFCAGGEEGRGTCRGDNGNAVMAASLDKSDNVHWFAVGIVSFEAGVCGRKDWPAVYTNISAYMPWILTKLRP